MPDPDHSIDIIIRTEADLAGARATEAQLERDIAAARKLGVAYGESEAQLQRLRAAISQHSETNAVSKPAEASPSAGPPLEAAAGLFDSLASVPLGLIRMVLNAAQQVGDIFSRLSQIQKQAQAAAQEKAARDKKNGSDHSSTLPNPPPNNPGPADSNSPTADESQIIRTFPDGDMIMLAPPREALPRTIPSASSGLRPGTPNPDAAPGGSPETGGDFASGVAVQTQALQISGGRLRAALEQNTAMTNSLFSQMLELIDSPNRKLGEVDRKISELGNQLKSLKNP